MNVPSPSALVSFKQFNIQASNILPDPKESSEFPKLLIKAQVWKHSLMSLQTQYLLPQFLRVDVGLITDT